MDTSPFTESRKPTNQPISPKTKDNYQARFSITALEMATMPFSVIDRVALTEFVVCLPQEGASKDFHSTQVWLT